MPREVSLVIGGERDTPGICDPADAIIWLRSGQRPPYSTGQVLGRLPGQRQAPSTAHHESWVTVPPEITSVGQIVAHPMRQHASFCVLCHVTVFGQEQQRVWNLRLLRRVAVSDKEQR